MSLNSLPLKYLAAFQAFNEFRILFAGNDLHTGWRHFGLMGLLTGGTAWYCDCGDGIKEITPAKRQVRVF